MAQTVCVLLNAADMARRAAIAEDRSRPLKHIQRARIVLLSAKRLSVQDVARRAGVSRPAVWRWQRRYGEAGVPPGKVIHAILDSVGPHKHPKVRAWLARHPRWTFHFTPTSASWLNAVEGFFSALTRRRLRRGSFTSVADLQAAIKRYIAEHNRRARPFAWTKPAADILAAVSRSPEPSV